MAPLPEPFVDLRSDTVTRPSAAMRRAMAGAEVGDDGYGEDPTVRRLEEAVAERLGKAAALFVPSGTMGNQIAVRLHGRPGTAVVAGRRSHLVVYERGATGTNAWAQLVTVDDADGTLDAGQVAATLDEGLDHGVAVAALCAEDTHMPSSGSVWPLDDLDRLGERARAAGVALHLDGARLFNAEVASGVPAARRARAADTVMCCLSKGLGAPVGSMLAGSVELVAAARDERKRLGGAMRQAGVLAAAGLVALDGVDRLADDHRRARRLADVVAERWPGCGLDPDRVRTNVVVFAHPDPSALLDHLVAAGVRAGTLGLRTVRLVTHLDVDDAGLERAVTALASAPA